VNAAAAVAAAKGGVITPIGTKLENGVAKTGLSGAANSEQSFTLEVPAGSTALSFKISGGSGDVDLYVKFGSAPTATAYDCRPFLNGNNETCTIANVQAGTYYVMLRAYSAYSGVSLVANYNKGGVGGNGSISETNVSGAANTWKHFSLTVAAGSSALNVIMSGGTGDADLYVRSGSQPTTAAYNCRPYKTGNNETCTISNPAAGTWYVSVLGYSAYSGVTVKATVP
jgi:serine protease